MALENFPHRAGRGVADERREAQQSPDDHRGLAHDANGDARRDGVAERVQNDPRAALVHGDGRGHETEDEVNDFRQRVNNVRHARRRLKAQHAEDDEDLGGGRRVRQEVAGEHREEGGGAVLVEVVDVLLDAVEVLALGGEPVALEVAADEVVNRRGDGHYVADDREGDDDDDERHQRGDGYERERRAEDEGEYVQVEEPAAALAAFARVGGEMNLGVEQLVAVYLGVFGPALGGALSVGRGQGAASVSVVSAKGAAGEASSKISRMTLPGNVRKP